ncbi:MAG: TetR/AcrR family transcriptional regulator [Anaerolineales bacterium]
MDEPGSRRGRIHNAEGARQAILNAAEEVFAEHGFDGARVDEIARRAGYNKSLLFQYFGDKLALYAEVIRRADEQTRLMQDEALSTMLNAATADQTGEIRKFLAGYAGWYFDYLVEHPHIQRIYMWEMAEGWQTFSKILVQRDFDDLDQFGPVLTRLQAAGLLRSDLNPLLQLSPALFMCSLYLATLPLYKALIPGQDFTTPAEMAHARAFVVEFIVNGLLVSPPEGKPQ